ncbi:hypothetical protein MA16_Dca002496 [Dendrobium catenatum]|uniref:Uncharacterized protein n=1 Tax=Dendrobium catenatum TaxID=906689 RepID=A0A2I0W0P9_9ASPA|nr:hypothetical protein MA16_Dca002496 [Dendrobium catenatum]
MVCSELGCCIFVRRSSSHRYQTLPAIDSSCSALPVAASQAVRVVVGKERREFLVDPFVFQTEPFRVLMEMACNGRGIIGDGEALFFHVDSILFDHMLWSVYNDFSDDSYSSSPLFRLNLREIIEFYSQDL